jgi:hypothetical protein
MEILWDGAVNLKRHWELAELIDHFTFLPNELPQFGVEGSS